MALLYIFIFMIPFLLVFAVKPEAKIIRFKYTILALSPLTFYLGINGAILLGMLHLESVFEQNKGFLSISDIPMYEQSSGLLITMIILGLPLGIGLTGVAELVWRKKYSAKVSDLPEKTRRLGKIMMIFGLPVALFLVPLYLANILIIALSYMENWVVTNFEVIVIPADFEILDLLSHPALDAGSQKDPATSAGCDFISVGIPLSTAKWL